MSSAKYDFLFVLSYERKIVGICKDYNKELRCVMSFGNHMKVIGDAYLEDIREMAEMLKE